MSAASLPPVTDTDSQTRPILTPKSVLPIFFLLAIIFGPIGGLLLWASDKVQEISIDYTTCGVQAPFDFEPIPSGHVSSSFSSKSPVNVQWRRTSEMITYTLPTNAHNTTICELQFDIPNELKAPVLLYYRLTKFYQNHRRYVRSIDQDQIQGQARTAAEVKGSYCDPLTLGEDGKPYYPCGLIANSLFNDTISSPQFLNGTQYPMSNSNIAWPSDATIFATTKYTADQVVPPPDWRKRYPVYNESFPIPDIHTWQELQVWMRTAGLPTFSKLALRSDSASMPAGTYRMNVTDGKHQL